MKIILPKEVDFIISTLHKNGFDAYAVGGCIRDSILGRTPNDWDITTNCYPEKIITLFSHTIPTGIKHGTITVMIDSEPFEVTTYRIDGEYSDNRHPDEVIFTNSLEEDLSRRDFTVNAMAYNNSTGIVDPFNGSEDLKYNIIKCVGNANNRFIEDALRMIRAIRFASQLNFNIDTATFDAIKENHGLISKVSVERIREELCKILLCEKPSAGIIALKDSGLLQYILPELTQTVGFDQRNPHHDKDVFYHTLAAVDYSSKDLVVRLGALFHDIGKPHCFSIDEKGIGHFYAHEIVGAEITEAIMKRLKFDNITIKKVLIMVKEHMNRFAKYKPSTLKKLMVRVGIDNLDSLFEVQTADIKASAPPYDFEPVERLRTGAYKILEAKQPLTVKDLDISGFDLIQLGLTSGKKIGEILNFLLEKVLENPEFNNKKALIDLIINNYKNIF
jgi:uncharacterized domain HDIG